MPSPSLALCFATIERPQVAQRLIRSVRKYFPDLPIYVADQSRQLDAAAGFYERHGVTLVRMPFDAGVAASRNRLAQTIGEDYFVLCDDDFVLGPQTNFADALHILGQCPEIGVVGGKLYDFGWGQESTRNWELFLQYDQRQRILFSIPIYDLAPKACELGGIRYFLCDAVLNFAVFRRAMFAHGAGWDERFKSNGEHEDFYLNLKINTSYLVAYLPTMVAYHHHPEEYRAYISRLRERNEGWKALFAKWGLEQHVEFGLGVRTLDDLSKIVACSDARSRFFLNAELSLRRATAGPDMVLVGDYERIAPVGALDPAGNALGNGAGMARLLLDPQTRAILAAPEPNGTASPAPAEEPLERYRLESSHRSPAVSATSRQIYYRYDAVLRADADFYLWYYCTGSELKRDASPRRLAATVRWTASSGAILVWKSRRIFLELGSFGYWQPLRLDVPLLPRGALWLRFDVVSDGGRSPDPVATGFLFAPGPAEDGRSGARTIPACEVLGLSRLPNDGATAGGEGRNIDEIGRTCPKRRIDVSSSALAPTLRVLPADAIPGLEALFFVGWESLGRPLVGVRLPASAADAPRALALPGAEPDWRDGRLYGYGAALGLLRLVPEQAGAPAHR